MDKNKNKPKGELTETALHYLASAKNKEETRKRLLEVGATLNRTERECKFCKIKFKRVEDGLFDMQIGQKDVCSKCALKKHLIKDEEKSFGMAG